MPCRANFSRGVLTMQRSLGLPKQFQCIFGFRKTSALHVPMFQCSMWLWVALVENRSLRESINCDFRNAATMDKVFSYIL